MRVFSSIKYTFTDSAFESDLEGMAALSSTSVVPAIAPSSTFSSPRLPLTRSLLFSTTGKERAFLTISKTPSRVYSQRSGFVPLVNAIAVKEVDVSKVVPQADRVLIKLEELSEKSIGGVLLPKSAVKFEHYLCGEVLSIGKEAAGVSVGQKVLFSDLNAYEVNFGTTEKLCFCKAGDLLAFVE